MCAMNKTQNGPSVTTIRVAVWLICAACSAAAAADPYTVEVRRVATPPVLDGRMDDACWKEAAVAGAFVPGYGGGAKRVADQTEVRLCYDAQRLYVFWKLFESRMEGLVPGPDEDTRDMYLGAAADTVQLLLVPRKLDVEIGLFSCPRGIRYHDVSSVLGTAYNPEWEVKAGRGEGFWTVEMAIPFAELARGIPGVFLGTPRDGEAWGIHFVRERSSSGDCSQWKPLIYPPHRKTTDFGAAVFKAPAGASALPAITQEGQDWLRAGAGSLKFEVGAGAEPIEAAYSLSRDGARVSEKRVKVEKGAAVVPFRIDAGGTWECRVAFLSGGQTVYAGSAWAFLPDLDAILATVAAVGKALPEVNRLRPDCASRFKSWRNLPKAKEKQPDPQKDLGLDENADFDADAVLNADKIEAEKKKQEADRVYRSTLEGTLSELTKSATALRERLRQQADKFSPSERDAVNAELAALADLWKSTRDQLRCTGQFREELRGSK